MRQGFFAVLGGDPLKGALAEVEGALLEHTGGRALWLVPYPLRDLAEAWRLAYKTLGLKEGRVLALRRREEAFDQEVAAYVAAFPLVLMAAEGFFEFLDLLAGSLVQQALDYVRAQGGVVAAVGEGAGLLGEAAFFPFEGGLRARLGLSLVPGLAVLPRVEERGRFQFLSRLVADNPDLVGVGLAENSAVFLYAKEGEVQAGQVTLVDPSGAEYTPRGVRGLRVDLLRAGERFSLPWVQ